MEINYKAEATAAKFHKSNKRVKGFMGPVGNGKSVTCIMEIWKNALMQWPNKDKVRKSRWAIVRNTLPDLKRTTIRTFQQWFPEEIAPISWSPTIVAKINQPLPDGTSLDLEIEFLSIDRDEDSSKLMSLEVTGIYLNEARYLPYICIKEGRGRIGRYPSLVDGYDMYWDDRGVKIEHPPVNRDGEIECARYRQLIMDTNPPDESHWWYQLAEEGCLRTVKDDDKEQAKLDTMRVFDFFRGPAPLIKRGNQYEPNPLAENIHHLPGGYQYYLDMIAGNTEDHINVQVLGNYGFIKEGLPVYPEYNDSFHVGQFKSNPEMPLALGWDFGLTPACIITQPTSYGQLRILAELTAEGMGVKQFARDHVKPFLNRWLPDCKVGLSIGDPSGNAGGEGEGKSAIGILNDDYVPDGDTPLDLGFSTIPCPTNDPTKRTAAVKGYLTRLVGHGEPGILIHSRCGILRKGFNGGYHYKKIQAGDHYKEKPHKNDYSHPHDALQYVAYGVLHGMVDDPNVIDYDDHYRLADTDASGY